MSKLSLTLKSTASVSKVDATPWSRELWRAACFMARRMIRDRATYGTGASWDWYLRAARRRFTTPASLADRSARGPRRVRPADPDQRHLGQRRRAAPPGSRAPHPPPAVGHLLGVVPYRCATVDRVRAVGLTFAWSADPLASSANQGLRAHRAMKLRQERATRREVAHGLAADRVAIETGVFFTLTDAGRLPSPRRRTARDRRRARRTVLLAMPPLLSRRPSPSRPPGSARAGPARRPRAARSARLEQEIEDVLGDGRVRSRAKPGSAAAEMAASSPAIAGHARRDLPRLAAKVELLGDALERRRRPRAASWSPASRSTSPRSTRPGPGDVGLRLLHGARPRPRGRGRRRVCTVRGRARPHRGLRDGGRIARSGGGSRLAPQGRPAEPARSGLEAPGAGHSGSSAKLTRMPHLLAEMTVARADRRSASVRPAQVRFRRRLALSWTSRTCQQSRSPTFT